uniref:Flavin-containing monooxygenase n=1 Tax=Oryza brachyantha TaxID=4533 RepID=J3MZV4_ORYBR
MAVVGYSEGATNIHTCEMMAKWVARLLDGAFRLPGVRRMEESVAEWGRYMRRSGGAEHFRRSCLASVGIWYNDQLCRDMGCNPRRKKGLLAEWFHPYVAVDY